MTEAAPIRVLIADDHAMVRAGLRQMISLSPRLEVVAEASDGREAVALYREHQPDVAILDLRMPDWGGIEAMTAIRAEFPKARLIALSHHEGEEDIYRAIQAGARTYVFKTVRAQELIDTIEAVFAGQRHLDATVATRLAERVSVSALTPRETDVLKLMVQGSSNGAIAEALGISHETVKVHVKRILSKLDVESRSQAISAALQRGIVHLD